MGILILRGGGCGAYHTQLRVMLTGHGGGGGLSLYNRSHAVIAGAPGCDGFGGGGRNGACGGCASW